MRRPVRNASRHLLPGLLAVLVLPAGFGCGGAKPTAPKTYPVSGQVQFSDGKPVAGGQVQFISRDHPNLTIQGSIQSDGSFTLHTLTDREKLTGAPEGSYQVTVLMPMKDDQSGGESVPLRESYQVKPGENYFPIKISPPRK